MQMYFVQWWFGDLQVMSPTFASDVVGFKAASKQYSDHMTANQTQETNDYQQERSSWTREESDTFNVLFAPSSQLWISGLLILPFF